MSAVSITSLLGTMSPERLRRLFDRDAREAAAWARAIALEGLAEAQLCYGRIVLEGTGTPADANAAFEWFQRAARQGNIEAINMVGRCHDMGWGTAEDPTAAAEYFLRAAEAGDSWAQYNLGHLYLDGRGVARDSSRAHAWYVRAAEQGHARAMNLVGRCCEEGWGRPRDPQAAAKWYERSARAGYFRGQFNWASHLSDVGRTHEAISWFERATSGGTAAVRSAIELKLAEIRGRAICPGSGSDLTVTSAVNLELDGDQNPGLHRLRPLARRHETPPTHGL